VKYFPLVWAGLWRRPARSILTLLSIATAFVLFGMLEGVNAGFAKALTDQDLGRLFTDLKVPGSEGMPISAMAEIEKVPGVIGVAQRAYFIGSYQQPKDFVSIVVVDPRRWFPMQPNLKISKQQLAALLSTRTGIVMTPALQKRYGWKIGDKIPLKSSIAKQDGSSDWIFDLVGTFDNPKQPTTAQLGLINYDYLDAARATDKGTVDRYIIRIADPKRSVAISAAVDRLFVNSSHETSTRSEKDMAQSQMKQVGDVTFLTNSIVSAVLFTLLFLTANAMKQSIRERTSEFAVMKTIGMSDIQVAALVLVEALLLCLVAAVLGLLLSALLAPLMVDVLGVVRLSWIVVVSGLLTAVLMAVVSAAPPAWRVHRLCIVEALGDR
jgi:putative ABC transport system permease protein